MTADVIYAGEKAGVVYWDEARRVGVFQYLPEFVRSGVELAPLLMPLRERPYQFSNQHESYAGLPGMLADCLPDTYGNALINDWLRSEGREPAGFSPVERLCYIGNRGMGALAYWAFVCPTIGRRRINKHLNTKKETISYFFVRKSS